MPRAANRSWPWRWPGWSRRAAGAPPPTARARPALPPPPTRRPQAVPGRGSGYAPPGARLLSGTRGEALRGGLRQRPISPATPGDRQRSRAALERLRSGNGPDDPAGDWTDYARAGVADAAGL